jgi:histidinol dehydrogenase
MMRILNLTPALERQLLRVRQSRDTQAERVAARIVRDVRHRGDAALQAWTKKLDGVDLRRQPVWISRREIQTATKSVSPTFLRAVKHAARNVRRVAKSQLPQPWVLEVEPGVRIGQSVQPIESIGCYIPGGRHALVSTLVMTAAPALLAGVPRVIAVCPHPSAELLAARRENIWSRQSLRHRRQAARQQRLRHRSSRGTD